MPRGDDDDATRRAAQAYDRALELVGERDVIPVEGSSPGFRSSAPWNEQAAQVATGIHALARKGEAALRALAGHSNGHRRGGSDANTHHALEAIAALANAAPEGEVDRIMGELARLAEDAAALPAIDEGDRWEPLPRQPGQQPYRCPYCHTPSLRFLRGKMVVACRRPHCKDSDGNRPAAQIGTAPRSAEPALLWADGLVSLSGWVCCLS